MNCTHPPESTQRIAVLYEQGTSNISTQSTSIGMVDGYVGSAMTTTTGTQQSLLAQKLAPPGHRPSGIAMGVAVVLGLVAYLMVYATGSAAKFAAVVGFAGVAVCIAYIVYWERFVRVPQLAGWQRTWHCNRCGVLFAEPGAYDAYNATKGTRRLAAAVTAAVAVVCFITVGTSMKAIAEAEDAGHGGSAATGTAHAPKFNAKLTRDYELKSFEGTCTLPQGTPVVDKGPLGNWKQIGYKEPMEKIAIDPALCTKLGKHSSWVAPPSALESVRLASSQ